MDAQISHSFEFGSFRIDPAGRRLLRDTEVVPLKSKAFDTLLMLVESAGQVVTKDHLMQAIWPDTVVEENNLTQNIYTLRKVLGERPGEHRYIVTVPGRGYSFVADVRELDGDRDGLLIGKVTRSRMVIEDELTVVDNGQARKAIESSRRRNIRAVLLTASVLGAALVCALIYLAFNGRTNQQPSGSQVRSIAVLPFKSLDPNGEDPSLGLKLADALIMRLGRLRQFAVR